MKATMKYPNRQSGVESKSACFRPLFKPLPTVTVTLKARNHCSFTSRQVVLARSDRPSSVRSDSFVSIAAQHLSYNELTRETPAAGLRGRETQTTRHVKQPILLIRIIPNADLFLPVIIRQTTLYPSRLGPRKANAFAPERSARPIKLRMLVNQYPGVTPCRTGRFNLVVPCSLRPEACT